MTDLKKLKKVIEESNKLAKKQAEERLKKEKKSPKKGE